MGTLFGIKAFAVAILGGITAPGGLAGGLALRVDRGLGHRIRRFNVHAAHRIRRGHSRARRDAERASRSHRSAQGLVMHLRALVPSIMTVAIAALTAAGTVLVFASEGYSHFILALVALTTVVGVGLNVLLGLSGQVSLGHVGFYAIGAYTAAILDKGRQFLAGISSGGSGCRRNRSAAGIAGTSCAWTLSCNGYHCVCLHRPARDDRMEGFNRWAERSHGARAAGDPRANVHRARDGIACDPARRGFPLRVPSTCGRCLGQGDGRRAGQRDRGAVDWTESHHHQDGRFCDLGDVCGTCRQSLRP